MSTPTPDTPSPGAPGPRPPRPPQGTRAELEATQIWWLRWIYVPVMSAIGLGALVVALVGVGDSTLALVVFALVVGSVVGAGFRFRAQRAETGHLSLDERDETQVMRTAGYAWCFTFFGVLAWLVAWAATHDGGETPLPLIVLVGLVASVGLGRLCTRREGY
jgi:predicted cobalt transporter CbtA